jgi:carbamoyltransferase
LGDFALSAGVGDSLSGHVWQNPVPDGAGLATGAALWGWHSFLGNPRTPGAHDRLKGTFLGNCHDRSTILEFLDGIDADYRRIEDEQELLDLVAACIASRQRVGWFQGRMEFGPYPLGARCILCDVRNGNGEWMTNASGRVGCEAVSAPAVVVPAESVSEWFEIAGERLDPIRYAKVRNGRRQDLIGGIFRIWVIDPSRHRCLHRLLQTFQKRTGCPLVGIRSFRESGKPSVCTPSDAFDAFLAGGLDLLVMEDIVLFGEGRNA